MKIEASAIPDVKFIEASPHVDERGGFARIFCAETFDAHGMRSHYPHVNLSWNPARATLRGLHFQVSPKAEAKLVRATRGSVFDVAVDVRPESATFGRWVGTTLDARRRNAIYIPEGFAHGYMTLEDESEVLYLVSEIYAHECSRELRWDDPALAIAWPLAPASMSPKDRDAPGLAALASS